MTLNDLDSTLGNMYHNAPKGEAVAMIHLFGIKYAAEIQACPFNKKQIAESAGIPTSFGTEISKGMKLSKYVTVNNNL